MSDRRLAFLSPFLISAMIAAGCDPDAAGPPVAGPAQPPSAMDLSTLALPAEMGRAEVQAALTATIMQRLPLPFEEQLRALALDGTRVGRVQSSISLLTQNGSQVYVLHKKERFVGGDGSFLAEQTQVFETEPPYRLLMVEGSVVGEGGRATRTSVMRRGDAHAFVKMAGGATVLGTIEGIDAAYTLLDVVAPQLWGRTNLSVGHRLTVTAFDFESMEIQSVTYRVSRKGSDGVTTIELAPTAGAGQAIIETRAASGALASREIPGFLRFEPAPAGTTNESVSTTAASDFRLTDELTQRPTSFDAIRAATVRVCSPDGGCGTGTIISSQGHILTARHVYPGGSTVGATPSAPPYVPEFEGKGTVELVYEAPHDDFSILKFNPAARTPIEGARARGGHALACVPLVESRATTGARVWAVGFPMAIRPAGNSHPSDGIRELTATGTVLALTPSGIRFPGRRDSDPANARVNSDYEGMVSGGRIQLTSIVGAPGISGGPVLNEQGRIVGISTAVRRYFFPATDDPHSGTYLDILSANEIRSRFEADRGRTAAQAAFRCGASTVVAGARSGSRFANNKEFLAALPAADRASFNTVVDGGAAVLGRTFRVLEERDLAGQKAVWSAFATRCETDANGVNEAVRADLENGAPVKGLVASEDLYPGADFAYIARAAKAWLGEAAVVLAGTATHRRSTRLTEAQQREIYQAALAAQEAPTAVARPSAQKAAKGGGVGASK